MNDDILRIHARNVNHALDKGVRILSSVNPDLIRQESRGGTTLEWPTPVVTVYDRPQERVLFSPARDANPFFHLFEALWMLAGRNDVSFVSRMVKRMASFSDNGITFHGAYGYRWRRFFDTDQIADVVALLRADPETRRAVIAMWEPYADLGTPSRDLPCNTHVYFKIRDGRLRMTICNRSNDVVWGAYGANAVHFSMLQEYVANKVGVEVGPMVQLSDSWHVYTTGPGGELWARLVAEREGLYRDPYSDSLVDQVAPAPLAARDMDWDADLRRFFGLIDADVVPHADAFDTQWWQMVAVPMWRAWFYRSQKELAACAALDWQQAGGEWLQRRDVVKKVVAP